MSSNVLRRSMILSAKVLQHLCLAAHMYNFFQRFSILRLRCCQFVCRFFVLDACDLAHGLLGCPSRPPQVFVLFSALLDLSLSVHMCIVSMIRVGQQTSAPSVAFKQLIYTITNLAMDQLGLVTKSVELNFSSKGCLDRLRSQERRRSARGRQVDGTLVFAVQSLSSTGI